MPLVVLTWYRARCLLPLRVFGCRWVLRTAALSPASLGPLAQAGLAAIVSGSPWKHLTSPPSPTCLPSPQGAFPLKIQPLLAPESSQINAARGQFGCCPVSSALGANTTIFSAATCLPWPPHHHLLISNRSSRPGPGVHPQPEES